MRNVISNSFFFALFFSTLFLKLTTASSSSVTEGAVTSRSGNSESPDESPVLSPEEAHRQKFEQYFAHERMIKKIRLRLKL